VSLHQREGERRGREKRERGEGDKGVRGDGEALEGRKNKGGKTDKRLRRRTTTH
jgi:hypothetical protein